MTPEGKIKAKVNKALRGLTTAYKFMPVQNGMGAPGLDFYCCIDGTFVAIETKVPGKKLTARQQQTATAIAQARGAVFVVRNDEDIRGMLLVLQRSNPQGTINDSLWPGK